MPNTTPPPCDRSQHYLDLMPDGNSPAAHGARERVRRESPDMLRGRLNALRRENAMLRSQMEAMRDARDENATLRGQIDALQGEIETMKRNRQADYERGKRDGSRLRGLPSIIAAVTQ